MPAQQLQAATKMAVHKRNDVVLFPKTEGWTALQGSHLKGAAAPARFRHITAIVGQRRAVMMGTDEGRTCHSMAFAIVLVAAHWLSCDLACTAWYRSSDNIMIRL
jgi:hypothetical protein